MLITLSKTDADYPCCSSKSSVCLNGRRFAPTVGGCQLTNPIVAATETGSHPWLALVSATVPDLDLGSGIRFRLSVPFGRLSPRTDLPVRGRTARPTTRGAAPGLPQARPGDGAATMKWSHESGNSIGCVITTTDRSAGGYLGGASCLITARKARRQTPWKRATVRHAQRST